MTQPPSRRLLLVSAALLVGSSALLWTSSRLTWVRLHAFDGLGEPRDIPVTGAIWSEALVPMALVLLACAVAILAVRGWLLRVLAVVVAAVSAGAAYLGVGMWAVHDVAVHAAEAARVPVHTLVGVDRFYGGAYSALAAALVALGAAVTLMRAGRGSATSKYRTPAARRAATESASEKGQQERLMWDSMDDGRDPTVEPGGS